MASLTLSAPGAARLSPLARGAMFGLGAVLMWGGYLALARAGVAGGLTAMDFALFRYGTAGLVMAPWLLFNRPASLAGVGWGRGAVLALLAGPPFILIGVGGYAFAPLAHGAVIQPAAMIICATLLSALMLRERPPRERIVGLVMMMAGLAAIAGPGLVTGSGTAPLGDAMFALAGASWALFTVLARRWAIPALPATAAVSVVSALVFVPIYVLTQDLSRLAALSTAALATQVIVQGVLSGVVAVIFFTRAAELAGAARAAVFPALVPAAAILIGIPVAGEWPNGVQLLGLAIVTAGLLAAIGVFNRRRKPAGLNAHRRSSGQGPES